MCYVRAMATANRKLAGLLRVPAWASFFTLSQYADFIRLITEDLARRGLAWKEDDGHALVRQGGGRAQRLGLLNIAQACHMEPEERWPRLLADFFDGLLRAESEAQHMLGDLSNLDKVRDRIKIRLYGAEYRNTPGADALLLRTPVEGILSVLVCDLQYANISVPRDLIAGWGLDEDEAYELALRNTLSQEEVAYTVMPPLPDGVVLEGIEGHSNYASTHLLGLERHLGKALGYGALVGVPNRHILFLHRIRDDRVTAAMGDLSTMTEQAYRDGPGSISKDLYWWVPDRGLRRLPIRREGEQIHVFADTDFYREVMLPTSRGN